MANQRRIAFRGDSRGPDEIFRNQEGFASQKSGVPITYLGDVAQETAVCVSWRLGAAAYFPTPYEKKGDSTWIYVVNVGLSDAKSDEIFASRAKGMGDYRSKNLSNKSNSAFINTHGAQVLDVMGSKSPRKTRGIAGLLFAQEAAVKTVGQKDILFAVRCIRKWNDEEDMGKGGSYKLIGSIVDNPHFDRSTITQELFEMTRSLVNDAIEASKQAEIKLPAAASGYEMKKAKETTSINESVPDEDPINVYERKIGEKAYEKYSLLHRHIDNSQFDEFKEVANESINDELDGEHLESLLSRALTEILINQDDRFARHLVSVCYNAESYADTPEIKQLFNSRPSLAENYKEWLDEKPSNNRFNLR
jgi:hypothetical protein